jgi:hypothetical protein
MGVDGRAPELSGETCISASARLEDQRLTPTLATSGGVRSAWPATGDKGGLRWWSSSYRLAGFLGILRKRGIPDLERPQQNRGDKSKRREYREDIQVQGKIHVACLLRSFCYWLI